ncbi:DUF2306 domain-containing protein [Micromonospora echinofusca]|uniref:DUF2306 domain-containing protein n=1 Tax=Micromonospora echinofusca TaxID=47858 RepID=A0ABS3VK57_MICEH|nr:DUF2306 domain-containing protein [Micromonospora echinofusca]MBO4204892.1 DUF2306 domain-containing protein [Micromonospora echinofusca]
MIDTVAPARRGTPKRAVVGFWWLTLSAVAVAVFAVLPYLTSSLDAQAAADNTVAANYATRPAWAQVAFYLHVVFGGLALALSPVQFAATLRRRVPRLHRVAGRVAVVAMVLAGAAGTVLAPMSLAGPVGTAGFGLLGVLWVVFAVAAYRSARQGRMRTHRRWAVRAFALTYAAVTLRLWLGVLIPLLISLGGVPEQDAFLRAYVLVPFLSWVPNLLLAEYLLRRRH